MIIKKAGILGSGEVGKTIAKGLLRTGHEVMIGSRNTDKIKELQKENPTIKTGSYEETARFGEILFLCTSGKATIEVINKAGIENFNNKTVVDITNPLIMKEEGIMESMELSTKNNESLGMIIQETIPKAMIVKALNTVTAKYMTEAKKVKEGIPTIFIAGNEEEAKKKVKEILEKWGWKDIIDIGMIKESYLLEALAMLWIRYGITKNHWNHSFSLIKE